MQKVLRAVFYFSGLIILSLGIILNTKSAFGVTPIISIAYCLSLLHGWLHGCVTATLLIGLLSAGHPVGVGVGTIAAMIGVGRFIWIYNRLFQAKQQHLTGVAY